MNTSHSTRLGLEDHEDILRTQSQRSRAALLTQGLEESGIEDVAAEEFRQKLHDPDSARFFRLKAPVYRRIWTRDHPYLLEIRLQTGSRPTIPFLKRVEGLGRFLLVARNQVGLDETFRCLEIEVALSLKHVRIWNKVVDSGAMGAIVLEDDFYLRNESSPADVASLVRDGFPDHDLIDLAGGLTRESLGLPESEAKDLSLPFLVANTTCGYFISKRACHALVEMVASNKELLYLAPDFLITELNVTDFTGSTLLPYDIPLVHGSRDGTVESSIPY